MEAIDVDANTKLQEMINKMAKKKKSQVYDTIQPLKSKLKVTIESVKDQPDKMSPLVGYSPSGFDPHNRSQQPNLPSVKVYWNKDKPKRLELLLKPNGSAVDFVGTNYSGEAIVGQMCTYALGILDKDTHQLKIVPIASNKVAIFTVRLTIATYVFLSINFRKYPQK
ncbi:hypothetical protein Nepgr_033276 [Nepenthes gracilis]|uniref:Uncharacterized protein n=1 Tax=Nepenthes gracilis TaxID=150966 RepID=A0AAD3TLZ7_NEPGR|nr:hypothetical protein Nepgr_033276 [Nepenthes gracilis]